MINGFDYAMLLLEILTVVSGITGIVLLIYGIAKHRHRLMAVGGFLLVASLVFAVLAIEEFAHTFRLSQ